MRDCVSVECRQEVTVGRLTVVGSCNIDLVTRTEKFPRPGEHLFASEFGTYLGGKGANQAVAARRAGASVRMVARVGRDAFGCDIRSALASDGIDIGGIDHVASAPTGNASIWLDAAGENKILVFPGANASLGFTEAMRSVGSLGAGDIVLMQLEVPMPTVVQLAQSALLSGSTVILNAAPARVLPDELWPAIGVLIVNETEAAALAGGASPAQAIKVLIARGCGAVVVTLGAHGCLLAQAGDTSPLHIPPYAPKGVVDATGAGDAFCGVFASQVVAGSTFREASRWGNAAGSLAVETVGAIPSMPVRSAIEARLAQEARA